jgi:hypothetical protein
MSESKFKENVLYQVEFANGSNMIVKVKDGFFFAPTWCKMCERMEWLKAIEPFNVDEVITILEINDNVEEYEKFFTEKNREKRAGIY